MILPVRGVTSSASKHSFIPFSALRVNRHFNVSRAIYNSAFQPNPGHPTSYKALTLLSGKNRQKTVWSSAFLLIRHSKYSAILWKIHFYRLLFRLFCPLGSLKIEFCINYKMIHLTLMHWFPLYLFLFRKTPSLE